MRTASELGQCLGNLGFSGMTTFRQWPWGRNRGLGQRIIGARGAIAVDEEVRSAVIALAPARREVASPD